MACDESCQKRVRKEEGGGRREEEEEKKTPSVKIRVCRGQRTGKSRQCVCWEKGKGQNFL